MNPKRLTAVLLLSLTIATVSIQTLPSDKAGKSYFKKLQSKKVASSDRIDWYQFGVGTAGYCEMIWQHPTDKDVMIMSPDMHNTYGTWDGGESLMVVLDAICC